MAVESRSKIDFTRFLSKGQMLARQGVVDFGSHK
jgi:hypothetical protein